jgi:hypothetical protein
MFDLTSLYSLPLDRAITTALTILVVILALTAIIKSRKGWRSHLRRKSLMTPNETEFYYRLKRALPDGWRNSLNQGALVGTGPVRPKDGGLCRLRTPDHDHRGTHRVG